MDEVALIRAVLANRDESTGYLVYADYLTEHGDPQGEIIRLSVEIDLMDDNDTRYGEVAARRDELLREHGEQLYRGLTRLGLRPEYPPGEFVPDLWLDRRGVIEEVKIERSDFFPRYAARLFAAAPFLRKLVFTRGSVQPARLAKVKQLSQLRELDLSSTDLSPDGLATLLRSKYLTRLSTLDLSGTALGDAGPDILCAWPGAATLTALDLGNCGVTERGVAALAGCSRLGGLIRLELNASGGAARAVFGSPHLTKLSALRLGSGELAPEGVVAVRTGTVRPRYPECGPEVDQRAVSALRTAAFRRTLRRLELGHASFPPGTFGNFTRIELPALEVLHLNSVALGDSDAECLATAGFRDTLTTLVLDNCGLGDASVEALVGGTFPKLKLLDLSRNRIGTRGTVALTRASKRLPSLTRLKLWGNSLGTEAMVQLATSKLLVGLLELDLRGNDIRPAGAVALANTRYLNNIVALRLDRGTVGKKGKKALGDTFSEGVLEYMDS